MNSDRPYSDPEQARCAPECCPDPSPQEGQPVGQCICPRKSYPGIVPDDPPGLGDIVYVHIGCPVHWSPTRYTSAWDVIREAEGFKVGDSVRARGKEVGTILHLVQVKGGRIRAHIHWPTIPFDGSTTGGSENFVDLVKLTKVIAQVNEQQLTLI